MHFFARAFNVCMQQAQKGRTCSYKKLWIVIEFWTTVKEDLWGFIIINIKTLETIGCAGSSINHQILPTNHTQNSRLPYHYGMTIFIVGTDPWENRQYAEYQLLCQIIFQDIFSWGLSWSVWREVFMLIIGPPFL